MMLVMLQAELGNRAMDCSILVDWYSVLWACVRDGRPENPELTQQCSTGTGTTVPWKVYQLIDRIEKRLRLGEQDRGQTPRGTIRRNIMRGARERLESPVACNQRRQQWRRETGLDN
jgi:hypothetical protein